MKQINVVFKCNPNCWESDWLSELFGLCNFKIQNRDFIGERCIVITDNPRLNLFEKFIKHKKKFILINLKDEFVPSKQDHRIYDSEYCRFVFRNYFRKNYSLSKILAFPLGYKIKFWENYTEEDRLKKQLRPRRKYIWSFAGVIKKSGRRKALQKLSSIQPNFVHAVSGWDTADSLSSSEYRDLLCDSYFVPCFRGNCSLDCFRVYESLECGAIPIVQKNSHIESYDFWRTWLGEHPLPVVNDIHSVEAYNYITKLSRDLDALEQKRVEVIDWWNSYKNNLKHQVVSIYKNIFNF